MSGLKTFLRTTIMGGLIVVLPIAMISGVFHWIFLTITDLIQPLTNLVMAQSQLKEIVADGVVLVVMTGLCFFIGLAVRTKLGLFFHHTLEKRLLTRFPGYALIKETLLQFLGTKKTPFSKVALVRLFGNQTMVTAFVTAEHKNGSFTIFMPTGPNPTSGNIYHVHADQVDVLEGMSVEMTMKSIIACGSGSEELVEAHRAGKR